MDENTLVSVFSFADTMFSFFHNLFPRQKAWFTLIMCSIQLVYWTVVVVAGVQELKEFRLTTGIVTEKQAVSYYNKDLDKKRVFSDMLSGSYTAGERMDVLYNPQGTEYAYGYFGFWMNKVLIHSGFLVMLSLVVTMVYFVTQLK